MTPIDAINKLYELRFVFRETFLKKMDLQSQEDNDIVDTITTKVDEWSLFSVSA